MEALVKVVSQLHKQWGIDCKPKDFTLAVARLLQIGVIDQPVDILHPEVWEKCTKALAEETMSSGRGKNLKSWGKVVHALQKAIQEQETWRAAKDCLLATPKLGVGAATQTLLPPDADDSAEPKDLQEGDTSPQSPNPDPLTEGQKRAKSFWGALAEEARSTAEKSEPKETWTTPPPYAPQDGAEHKEEGRGEDASGGNREEALKSTSAHKQEGEENEEEKSGGDERGEKGGVNEGRKPNQSGYRKKCPHRANTLSIRRRGGSRWRERPAHKGRGRGRSPTKRYRNPEVTSQSSSDSGSDASWDEWLTTDSNLEEKETKINRVKSQNIPIQIKEEPGGGEIPLTDWRKIKTACADWAPSAALAFPVRVTDGGQRVHSPINPKDIQTIVKAIADKGLNSALVSTLIDGIFGGDDMLPFDIKQTCRLIFDGAGMIVFKQEWEDNCTRQLARVTGADHPLHGSSLQRLMGTDPTMITPHAQAQGLRAHEVMTTTRAAREAIRVASRVVAKPSPWSTIKQNESESFTQFVDRLQAAIASSTLPVEAKGPVLADCLRQQCNSKAKEILRSLPAGSTIADMIKRVANEEHLAPIQVAVRTAIANMIWKVLPQGMINSPTICQITVDRALAPVRRSDPTATIIQYMDDILIAAPSGSQVDQLVSTVSDTLKTNGFEIASAKIKRGPCLPTQSVAMSEHLAVALVGFGGEVRHARKPPWTQMLKIIDIDLPQKVMDRPQPGPTVFTDASSVTSTTAAVWQSEGEWHRIKMTDRALSVQQLEAAAVVLACGLFPMEHLNIVTDSMFVAKLCLAMSGPGVSTSTIALMLEEALFSRKGTISVIHVNSHDPIKGFFQTGNDKADAAAKGLWTLRDARQLHESLHIGAKALAKRCGISATDAKHIVATCPHCQKTPLWSSGVNPRGLKASEVWQTDFTFCQLLKPRAWLAVTVDTYSGMIVATQHLKTDSKATIQHWLTAMAWRP
ncbi:E3 ubiquitin-protein ligase RBBP6-like [Grus japonensis]|uniref:E3 ubiquitin-protein ligase RBBP6-like n=1 Tax=Grus japonensis TaxID=30415 RepID=A0ABC9XIQ6_GRUJA